MGTVKRGETYVYRHRGWLGGVGHLDGKRVVALDNGGTGIFETSRIEVRCTCGCGRRYTVDASDLL